MATLSLIIFELDRMLKQSLPTESYGQASAHIEAIVRLVNDAKKPAPKPTMKERCLAVAKAHTPEGCVVTYRKSLSGTAWVKANMIAAPNPVTRRALYVYLHECAHIHLSHTGKKPVYVQEMEAEKWAHEKMREAGLAVPKKETKRAKQYVASKIGRAQRRGAKKIDRRATKFAKRGQ